MAFAASFLQLPPIHSLKLSSSSSPSSTLTTSFLHGSTPLSKLSKPNSSVVRPVTKPQSPLPTIKAMRLMQGKVVCATNDKTVAVEVTRLAPHPKYKRRVRKKKKFQAHDPLNQFKVGDIVQLEKSRPISKTKAFLAIPIPSRNSKNAPAAQDELSIPLESQQPQA